MATVSTSRLTRRAQRVGRPLQTQAVSCLRHREMLGSVAARTVSTCRAKKEWAIFRRKEQVRWDSWTS
jgi:hypothetical protein